MPGDGDFGLFWKATSTLSVSTQKKYNSQKMCSCKKDNNNSGEKCHKIFIKDERVDSFPEDLNYSQYGV